MGLHGCLYLCRLEKNLGLAHLGLRLDRRHWLECCLRLGRDKGMRLHLGGVPLVLEVGLPMTLDWD